MPVLVARSISVTARKIIVGKKVPNIVSLRSSSRLFSDKLQNVDSVHFRATSTPHPLASEGNSLKASTPRPTLSGLDDAGKPITEVIKCIIWSCHIDENRQFMKNHCIFLSRSHMDRSSEITLVSSKTIFGKKENWKRSSQICIITSLRRIWIMHCRKRYSDLNNLSAATKLNCIDITKWFCPQKITRCMVCITHSTFLRDTLK